jgi:5'-nucleotidase
MRFLLTNDDGIDAAGLEALARAAATLGETTLVAPHVHLSGCSHRVTTDQPLRAIPRAPDRWAIEGTPADCVRVGLAHLLPNADWVLSGLNHGGNLGADVHVSGTVAAAREAVLHGKPAVALSQYKKRDLDLDWERAIRWVIPVLGDIFAQAWVPGTFWNINLPHLRPEEPEPRAVFCPLEPGPLPLSFRREADLFHYNGVYHQRARRQGSDVDVCFGGNIALTRIALF